MYCSSSGAMRWNSHFNVRYMLSDDDALEHYLFRNMLHQGNSGGDGEGLQTGQVFQIRFDF